MQTVQLLNFDKMTFLYQNKTKMTETYKCKYLLCLRTADINQKQTVRKKIRPKKHPCYGLVAMNYKEYS